MGVIKALEAQGFEPGDEIEIGDVAFALYPGSAAAVEMSLTVVKLGSTLVADERGDVRADVLREVCRQVAS